MQRLFTATNNLAVVFNLGVTAPEGSWIIFRGVASRYFRYTGVLHLLYSSFRCGSLSYGGLLIAIMGRGTTKVETIDLA